MVLIMDSLAARSSQLLPIVALTALGLALTALTFAGWLHFGDAIVLSLSESGLAFCL
ncbi:hypothetical protein D3C87_2149840 [compost metagenome]